VHLHFLSEDAAPCDPITFLEMGDAFADRNHCFGSNRVLSPDAWSC